MKIRLFLSLRFVPQQQCNGHCPCNCPARQLKQLLRSALVAAQWRGDTALTLSLFWRRSTVSPIFFGRYPRSSLHPFVPFPPPPPLPSPLRPPPPTPPSPFLISHLASVDVKQNVLDSDPGDEWIKRYVWDKQEENDCVALKHSHQVPWLHE